MNLQTRRPRVLVLGGTGMLGSMMVRELGVRGFAVHATARRDSWPRVPNRSTIHRFDAHDEGQLRHVVSSIDPDLVVNAIGVVKQAPGLAVTAEAVRLNALLPHVAAAVCHDQGVRLVHVSTDCVFSGRRGRYAEVDTPDPVDFYGRSKLLGEVHEGALTLRTSIIGPENARHASLLDWFLTQEGREVTGFRGAIYSGLPTVELARIVAENVLERPDLAGVYHVAAPAINKFDLLRLIAQTYGWRGTITPSDEFKCDRSLLAKRFEKDFAYTPPSWEELVARMYEADVRDFGPDGWRRRTGGDA